MAKDKTKSKGKKALKVLCGIVITIAIIAVIIAIVNLVSMKSVKNFITSVDTVEYAEQLSPEIDNDGYYTFTTDKDFRVMQLTDVHFGGGFLSVKKDNMAINAVSAMVTEEKPDLVIVTGDIAYPVPFQSGTFNNKIGAVEFAQLMEELGVYWCLAYGNHDTEAYSYHDRKNISELYSNKEKYPHCLFQSGPDDVDGYGNYIVKVKNSVGEIVQSFIMMDSHAYIDNDYLGILWKYDCIHSNQIDWYENEIKAMTEANNSIVPKTDLFLHMPIQEIKTAFEEYAANDYKDTEDTQFVYGKIGEKDNLICSSSKNYGLFDKCLELGSTQGIFFGHDHLNNCTINYKGIQLTYGYSVDYLAYSGIYKFGAQRGCTMLTVHPDGSLDTTPENYYQDKYQSINQKENVLMTDYYGEE